MFEYQDKSPIKTDTTPPRAVRDFAKVDEASRQRQEAVAAASATDKRAQATRRQRLGHIVAAGAASVALVSPVGERAVVQPLSDKIVDVGNIAGDVAGDVVDAAGHALKVTAGFDSKQPTEHDSDGIPG